MTIDEYLRDYLLVHPALVAVIGTGKVFLVKAPDKTELDFVVVTKLTGRRIGKIGFGAPLFQVSYFSNHQERALAGADILVAALDNHQDTWGGLLVHGSYQEDRILEADGVFHAPVEVRVKYLEV